MPAALVVGMLLAMEPVLSMAGRGGEGLPRWLADSSFSAAPVNTIGPFARVYIPDTAADTTRRPLPDSLRQRPALVPDANPGEADDNDKPTRKTALFAALTLAVLTISTLLLYNVRSR